VRKMHAEREMRVEIVMLGVLMRNACAGNGIKAFGGDGPGIVAGEIGNSRKFAGMQTIRTCLPC
jgi:hypothetical protein